MNTSLFVAHRDTRDVQQCALGELGAHQPISECQSCVEESADVNGTSAQTTNPWAMEDMCESKAFKK